MVSKIIPFIVLASVLFWNANIVNAFQFLGNTSAARFVNQQAITQNGDGSSAGSIRDVRVAPGEIVEFSFNVKNTSRTEIFYGADNLIPEPAPFTGAHQIRVGAAYDKVYDGIFDFSFGGPFEHNNRFATFETGAVRPGEGLGFYWTMKIRDDIQPGTYRFTVGVVKEFDSWLGDRTIRGIAKVNNDLGGWPGGKVFWNIIVVPKATRAFARYSLRFDDGSISFDHFNDWWANEISPVPSGVAKQIKLRWGVGHDNPVDSLEIDLYSDQPTIDEAIQRVCAELDVCPIIANISELQTNNKGLQYKRVKVGEQKSEYYILKATSGKVIKIYNIWPGNAIAQAVVSSIDVR